MTLTLVPASSPGTQARPFRWNTRPPVASCIESARSGEFWSYMDSRLLAFLQEHVNGAPLGASVDSIPRGPRGSVLSGTAHLLTSGTSIELIWASPTGDTSRSYNLESMWMAETWGDRIEGLMFDWVRGWLTSVVGSCGHDDLASIWENVADVLQRAESCEWNWERSRRSMSFGQLKSGLLPHRH